MSRLSLRMAGLMLACSVLAPPAQCDERDDAVAAVRQAIDSYVAAYNRGDAAAVADHWSEDAEYVLPDGERIQGREAIQRVFEQAFSADRSQIEVPSPRVRLLSDTVAVEEGVARVSRPGQPPEETSYLAIHIKQPNGWKLTTVRETEAALPSESPASEHLQQLEWLVGEWTDQSGQAEAAATVRWSGKRAFLTYSFSVAMDEVDPLEGTQVIGWDPVGQVIRSWLFDSDGGFGHGVWSHDGDHWVVEFEQTLPDGRQAKATNIYTVVDQNTFKWHSIGRTIDGEPLPNVEDVTIIRKTAADSAAQSGE